MKKIVISLLLNVFIFGQVLAQGSLSSGLVLNLPFNGNTLDMSGNGNHATNYGATLSSDASGRTNCAYSFNGSTDYMEILNSVSLQVDSQMSLCAKVRVKGFYNGVCYNNSIIDKNSFGQPDYVGGWYSLRFTGTSSSCYAADTHLQNYTGFFAGSYITPSLKSNLPHVVTTGIWDCLVFTYNGDSAKMYVNGVLRHSFKGGTIGKNTGNVTLAKKNHISYPYWFKGVMDDVRIYKRALSSSEVSDYCSFVAPSNTITANFKDSTTKCLSKQFTDLSSVSSTAIKLWFWDFGDGGQSSLKNPLHLYSTLGVYNVRLIVVDSNGFSDTITRPVIVGALSRFAKASNDTIVCKSSSGVPLSLNASGGLYYSWMPTTGLSNPSIANPIATIVYPISYVVTVTDSLGCMDLDTINIYWDLGFADAGNDTNICFVDGKGIINLNASGGVDYLWTPTTGLSNPTIKNPIATISNSTKYFVQVTNGRGCVEVDSIILNQRGRFANAINDTSVCLENGTAIVGLFASGGVSYLWSPSTGLSNNSIPNPVATINASIAYVVTVKDVYGCEDKDTVSISIKSSNIDVNVSPKKIQGCDGKEFQLGATGAKYYKWFPSSGLDKSDIPNPKLTLLGSFNYVVVGTDSLGCTDRDSIFVTSFKNPIIKVSSDNTKADCLEKSALLNATGALSYSWTPAIYCESSNAATTKVRPPATTVFTVKGIDQNGCVGEDTITVFYEGKSAVKVPNAFTPNNDGINDKIRPIIVCDFEMTEFSIYNRWGNRVFTSNNVNTAWDGTFQGNPCDMNAYYYLLKGKDSKGQEVLFKGDIILIR